MSEQFDSLNEKTRLIEAAMKFVGNDIEKAKSMASGQYLDNIIVKIKFFIQSNSKSGLVMAFFNIIDEYISNVDGVVVNTNKLYDKVRIFDDWKTLYRDINLYKQSDEVDSIDGFIDSCIDKYIEYDVFPEVQERLLDDLTKKIHQGLSKIFSEDKIQCQIELEPTSSLSMELAGVPVSLPEQEPGSYEKQPNDSSVNESEFDKRIKEIEKEAKYIVNGTSIVAPVKGKYINDIEPGEKIMVLLPNKDQVSRKILSVMEAVDSEGNIKPIKGRLKHKIPMEKSGYIIYALIAKGVYAKLVEEENVKVRMEDSGIEQKNAVKDSKLIYIMLAVLVLFVIGGLLLFIML